MNKTSCTSDPIPTKLFLLSYFDHFYYTCLQLIVSLCLISSNFSQSCKSHPIELDESMMIVYYLFSNYLSVCQ